MMPNRRSALRWVHDNVHGVVVNLLSLVMHRFLHVRAHFIAIFVDQTVAVSTQLALGACMHTQE